jgi:hypothetical protein
MLEYIPGKYSHRPVDAEGYMFIHCIFVGFKNEYKGKGYASSLIDECIKDAKKAKMQGVAVVTRKGLSQEKVHLWYTMTYSLRKVLKWLIVLSQISIYWSKNLM